ncbi:hypothetical protein A165_02755 [Vibrio tasmaniensis ZS-17]|uniref:hypothetical protein n=1 Tax=Vibrio TaxID=662 RepID=UPI000381FE8E|nr:hypothetical protein [Vibrio tasmaniensis]OED68609.1 hypothetical protein A165_02755 [Vibrio tasmaniensis ZS-17]
MTKKNNTNQNTPKPSTDSISESHKRVDIFDHALNREMPTGGKSDVNTIMQRTATPPMPDSGNTKKQ